MAEGIVKASKQYYNQAGVPTIGTPERMGGDVAAALTLPNAPTALPTMTVAPAITGTTTSGQTLTLSAGTYTGSPTFVRQWLAGGVPIVGATGATFLLTGTQVGKKISATVYASNEAGVIDYTTPETAVVA